MKIWIAFVASLALAACSSGSGGAGSTSSTGAAGATGTSSTTSTSGATTTGGATSSTGGSGTTTGFSSGSTGGLTFTPCPPGSIPTDTNLIGPAQGGLTLMRKISDGGGVMERWLGRDCTFAIDPSFPPNFSRTYSDALMRRADMDSAGNVYAPHATGVQLDVIEVDPQGATTTPASEAAETIAVTPDGLMLYTTFVSEVFFLTRPDAGEPFMRPSSFVGWRPPPLRFIKNVAVLDDGRTILAGAPGYPDGGWATLDGLYELYLDGGIGSSHAGSDRVSDPDAICWTGGLGSCGTQGGYCTVDSNCNRFAIWATDGGYTAGLSPSSMSGSFRMAVMVRKDAHAVYVLQNYPNGALGVISGIP